MGADQNTGWGATIASALDWWSDAGVDTLVDEAPRDWLAIPAPAAVRAVDVPQPAAAPETLPTTLEAFLAWRAGSAAPDAGWPGARFPASGCVGAKIMVLVDCPERDDCDTLLGGPSGRLFDRMLAAIGLTRDDIHLASVCAARPAAGRMPRDTEARLGEVARHHITLVAPQRVLTLGNAASRAVLGTDAAAARGGLRVVNHPDGKMTHVVASFHPRFLLEKPACKADAWKDLQLLVGGMTT